MHKDTINCIDFNCDGSILASGSVDNTIILWNYYNQSYITTLYGHKDLINSIAFSPDNKILASGSDDRTIKLWNL